jgi:hypothetical protein
VPFATAVPPLRMFVKLERPRELDWGFFDESGWWPVATAPGVPARPAPTVPAAPL